MHLLKNDYKCKTSISQIPLIEKLLLARIKYFEELNTVDSKTYKNLENAFTNSDDKPR